MSNTFLSGFIVIFYVVISQVGLTLFHAYLRITKRKLDSNEVAGIMFGVVSAIYSLILAFVIVAVWSNYEDLTKTIDSEADKLNSILAHSITLPEKARRPIHDALQTYCSEVIIEEFRMRKETDVIGPSAIPNLRLLLLEYHPKNGSQSGVFSVLDDDLSAVSDLRRTRLGYNRSQIPKLVWAVLVIGSFMLVVFSYFFKVESEKLKRIYLFFLTSFIAMCMFLVYALDQPFTGSAVVSYQPYENILHELKPIKEAENTKKIKID